MTDKQLLKELKKDRDKGLSLVIDLYGGLVYKIVSSLINSVGTPEDTEECVNDIFLSFYQSAESISLEKASIKTYLAVIAKRKAIDLYRKLKSRRLISIEESSLHEEESACLSKEERQDLINAIKALGEPDTTIITRRYFLGETAEEIARELTLSKDAVQKRLERSRLKLKECLGGVFSE